ncbi:hypothetical protein DH2020_019228 [Rehmannia glutinosa]|uniref:Histone deacetylase domain-containing protein n=1 Tax=Rehmannia glutinosa TaxID=99300 RepID=A0ABR0WN15_REHGL
MDSGGASLPSSSLSGRAGNGARVLLLRANNRQLLLRPRSPNEASSYPHGAQSYRTLLPPQRMEISSPFPAGPEDIRRFHTEYAEFLSSVTPTWSATTLTRVTSSALMLAQIACFSTDYSVAGLRRDVGVAAGKYYALNVPLHDGLSDENFRSLFRPIIQKVMEVYQPDAVVLQCGADSLGGDRLGRFNLSVKGHADCLRFLRSYNVPLMVLGGGGYTIRNVARCWCYETAVAVDVEPDNKLPYNDYFEYFGPNYTLHVEPGLMVNLNTKRDLEKIR